jgi:hypothetical protein
LKEVTQWHDIHNLLSALHESLIHQVLQTHDISSGPHFTIWLTQMMKDTNADEISRFWAQTLYFMNAYMSYYFAIWSGNYHLRNAALPILAELFCAYGHNKYEELVCETIKDVITMPDWITEHFLLGEWTVSVTGKYFHNIALDEAHESVINKRLKELTTRPSEYRTVCLANFMAYLDKFMSHLHHVVYKYNTESTDTSKGPYDYSHQIVEEVKKVPLFVPGQLRTLHNIFSEKSPVLDSETVHDLLSISNEGQQRMARYIAQYVIHPPLETPQKRRRRKMRTFTKKKQTA